MAIWTARFVYFVQSFFRKTPRPADVIETVNICRDLYDWQQVAEQWVDLSRQIARLQRDRRSVEKELEAMTIGGKSYNVDYDYEWIMVNIESGKED